MWRMRPCVQLKVMLRVSPVDAGRSSFLTCSGHLQQVTLLDQSVCGAAAASPATPRRRPTAPKTFAFDAVFTQDSSLVSISPLSLLRTGKY